jgi:hypothetical protein
VIAVLRRWWRNPQTALRLTLVVIIAGGVIAGIGTFLRNIITGQNDQWTFILDTFGLLIAVLGAVLDFRATGRVAEFAPGFGRRRAALELTIGAILALSGCYLLGWVVTASASALLHGVLSAALTAGFGLVFASLLYFGWFSGSEYLGRQIEQRSDEEW